jgi:hypothetical protein
MAIAAVHPPEPPARDGSRPARDDASLEALLAQSGELYSGAKQQLRDTMELACMEFELTVEALKWWAWALLLFGSASIMTFSLLIVSVTLWFLPEGVSAVGVILMCTLISAIVAASLMLMLRSLSKRIFFPVLRRHLSSES